MCGTRRHSYARKGPAGRGLPALPNPVVTERATLGRSKFCIEEQGFVRAGFCAALGLYQTLADAQVVSINRTESGAGAPRSKNFSSNP